MKMQGISKNTISYGISNPVKNCVLESVSNIFFTLQGDPTKMGYLKKTRLRKPYGIIEQLFFSNKTDNQFSPRPRVKHFLFPKHFVDLSNLFHLSRLSGLSGLSGLERLVRLSRLSKLSSLSNLQDF